MTIIWSYIFIVACYSWNNVLTCHAKILFLFTCFELFYYLNVKLVLSQISQLGQTQRMTRWRYLIAHFICKVQTSIFCFLWNSRNHLHNNIYTYNACRRKNKYQGDIKSVRISGIWRWWQHTRWIKVFEINTPNYAYFR